MTRANTHTVPYLLSQRVFSHTDLQFMPRLAHSLLLHARSINPLLVPLLRICRNLPSALNELRWLRQSLSDDRLGGASPRNTSNVANAKTRLKEQCLRRGRGVPLQYILGTEYFGELELACRPGVLIPRPDTASLVLELARRLRADHAPSSPPRTLRVLDLCTGSGCMSLLLHHELRKVFGPDLKINILGIDISRRAIELARHNRRRLGLDQKSKRGNGFIHFVRADVLGIDETSARPLLEVLQARGEMNWDIILCNPPYISRDSFYKTVARSVRNFEPRIALVPPQHPSSTQRHIPPNDSSVAAGDTFYPRLLELASFLSAKTMLFEVSDLAQALRVVHLACSLCHDSTNTTSEIAPWDGGIEIWRDGLDDIGKMEIKRLEVSNWMVKKVVVRGPMEETEGRGVCFWGGEAARWMIL